MKQWIFVAAKHTGPWRRKLTVGHTSRRFIIMTPISGLIGNDMTHTTARIMDIADGGDVLVSGVVRGLVAGSGSRFEGRGNHEFRGIPGKWSVYAVAD